MNKLKSKSVKGAILFTLGIVSITACANNASASSNSNKENTTSNAVSESSVISKDNSKESSKESTDKVSNTNVNRDLTTIYSAEDLDTSTDGVKIDFSGDSATVNGEGAEVSGGVVTITKAGTYVLSGELKYGSLVVKAGDEDLVHIVLNGTNITSSTTSAINISKAKKVVLTLADSTENTLSDAGEYTYAEGEDEPDAAVFSSSDLVINGNGTLTVLGNAASALKSKDNLTIISGKLNLTSKDNAIKGKDSVVVENTELLVNAKGKGITTEGNLYIYNGNIDIKESEEGLEGKQIELYGGNINIVSTDDGINEREKADKSLSEEEQERFSNQNQTDTWLKVEGGTIYVDAAGDGIDSNGQVYINGGELIVYGPTDDGNATLDYNGEAVITGGTYIGLGSSGMAQGFSDASTQNSVEVFYDSTQNKNTNIAITDASGNTLFNIEAKKNFSDLLFSSSSVKTGDKLTIKTGDDTKEVTVEGVNTTTGESGGRGGMGQPPQGGRPQGQPPQGQPPRGRGKNNSGRNSNEDLNRDSDRNSNRDSNGNSDRNSDRNSFDERGYFDNRDSENDRNSDDRKFSNDRQFSDDRGFSKDREFDDREEFSNRDFGDRGGFSDREFQDKRNSNSQNQPRKE